MRAIRNFNTDKGLTSTKRMIAFPLGKKGSIVKHDIKGNIVSLDYGATIKDNDRRNVITCISFAMKSAGYDRVSEIKEKPLEHFREGGQVAYTSFSIKASEISKVLYGNTRDGRYIAKSLKSVAHLQLDVNEMGNVFNQVSNIAYRNGIISFSVANYFLNIMANTILPFRLASTLLHTGFEYRLSFYVETNQYSGRKKGTYFPKQTYSLDELVSGLDLAGKYRNDETEYIKKIQKAFDILHSSDANFPQYRYDKNNRFFYNKYKKSADRDLF